MSNYKCRICESKIEPGHLEIWNIISDKKSNFINVCQECYNGLLVKGSVSAQINNYQKTAPIPLKQ